MGQQDSDPRRYVVPAEVQARCRENRAYWVQHVAFVRPPELWQALGAPSSMWDDHEAARAWQTFARPQHRLRYLDPRDLLAAETGADLGYDPPPTTAEVLAHNMARLEAAKRWWRATRWYFLAQDLIDALTADELRHVEVYRPTRWLADLDPYQTELHLFGRSLRPSA